MSRIFELYQFLYDLFGEQDWWPCEGEKYGNEEIAIGAVLTQNTSWKNVEKALNNLKKYNLLSFSSINVVDLDTLRDLIRPAGFYNQKSIYLKNLASNVINSYGSLRFLFNKEQNVFKIRNFLLSIKGIGKETADSIILYAGFKPIFVVDKYTYRIFSYLGLWRAKFDYDGIRSLVESQIKEVYDLQQFHALLVELSKSNDYMGLLDKFKAYLKNNF